MTSSELSSAITASLEAMLQALPDPAMLIEPMAGHVLAVNDLAASWLDCHPRDLIGIEAVLLREPQERDEFSQTLGRLAQLDPPPSATLEESLLSRSKESVSVLSQLRAFHIGVTRCVLHIFQPRASNVVLDRSHLRAALARLPIAVMLSEPDHPSSLYLNPACASLLGVAPGFCDLDSNDRTWRLCFPNGEPLAVQDFPTVRAFGSEIQAAEPTCQTKDFQLIPANSSDARSIAVTTSLIQDADGNDFAAIATVVEGGSLRELERDLLSVRKGAEDDARRKGAFYASLSRELRNPLTSILGYLDLIADPESPEKERTSWYAQIRKSGESLMNLVQDLVDLGQMEAGTFFLEQDSCSTSLALAHVLSQARARAQQKDRDVIARYTTPVPRALTLDPGRFRQCLSTLSHFVIENTFGDVTLQTAVIGQGPDRRLAFDVSAQCRDLAQGDLDTLFDPFLTTTPRTRPWSLSFPVAKRLAEMMGGTIECGIEAGRLWIRLTIRPTHGDFTRMVHLSLPDDQEPPPSTHPIVRLRGTVLLVEDNESDRLLVTKMLERSGLRVEFVTGGRDACSRPLHRYDAILMDLELPDMDGLETTRRLRAQGVTVPIVALTASVLTGDRERCLDAGCTAYVAKPIDRPMLLRTLDGLISTTEDRRVMSVLPPELAGLEPLPSTLEDDPSLTQILPQFITRMGRFVEHIARAIPDQDFAVATKTARSLGATAGSCGFPALADASNALADACSNSHGKEDEIQRRLENLESVTKRIRAAYAQLLPPT